MLYVHIPYCHQKCTYCAFYSTPSRRGREQYVEALIKEIENRAPEPIGGRLPFLHTLYFGGGTPSLLPLPLLERILYAIERHYDLSSLEEATLEANPEDLTRDYLIGLKQFSIINRLSIGVQSFHDDELKLMNRACRSRDILSALDRVGEQGWKNVSVDLIYALPQQDLASWKDNLQRLEPYVGGFVTHLSAYSLTLEPNSILSKQIDRGLVRPSAEDDSLLHYQYLLDWSQKVGLRQYEISSFAKPGFHSRHNSNYWNRTPYLGVGAAAHSFDGTHRRWNVSDVALYTQNVLHGGPYSEVEELSLKDAYNEYIMTALRTTRGIEKALVPQPFVARLSKEIGRFSANGLLRETPTHYQPTPECLLQADGIASSLFIL